MGKIRLTKFTCRHCGRTETIPGEDHIPEGWIKKRILIVARRRDKRWPIHDTFAKEDFFCSMLCAESLGLEAALLDRVRMIKRKKGEKC
jgi:hypothetical protein